MLQGLTQVETYLPDGPWYNYYDGTLQKKVTIRQVSPSSNIGLYVRGGHILPMQRPANNTTFRFNFCIAVDMFVVVIRKGVNFMKISV